jgi:hypothetical protein
MVAILGDPSATAEKPVVDVACLNRSPVATDTLLTENLASGLFVVGKSNAEPADDNEFMNIPEKS